MTGPLAAWFVVVLLVLLSVGCERWERVSAALLIAANLGALVALGMLVF